MDCEEFDEEMISPERLKISESRWIKILVMLIHEDYITGIQIHQSADGYFGVSYSNPAITLKGLEYLNENSMMKKAANIAKGIKDIIPGI